MAAELEACRKMINSQEQLLGDSAPLAARETARATAEAHRANALQSQLRQVTEQHAHERTLASGLQDKVTAIEAQLRETLASHEQELMTLGDKHATSEKQLRSRLATALGGHSYMEKALERARVQADTALDTFEKRLDEERTKFKSQLSAAQLARAEAEARMKEATRESGSIKLTLTSQESLQTTARNAILDAERADERMREMHEKMLEAEKLAKDTEEVAAAKIAAIRAGSASEGHAMTHQVAERERQVKEEREKRRVVEDELSALRNQMRYVEKADAERTLRLQAKLENAEHEAQAQAHYKGKLDDLQQRYRRLEDDLAATKADLSDVKASKARLEAGWSPEELPGNRAAIPYQAGVTTQMAPETRQARAELTRIDGERRRLEHANMELERRVASLQQSCIELQEGKGRVEMDFKRLQREKEDGVARAYASVDDMRREMEIKVRDSELAAIAKANTVKLESSEATEEGEERCRQLEGSLAAAKQQLDRARAQSEQCAAHEVIKVMNALGELRCPICTKLYADPHSLQTCFHTFCKACVVPALIEYESPKCPLCQMTARRTDLMANAAMKAVVTRAASISQSYSSQTVSAN
ncbi:hypothetical protein CYMTET_50745 [Cymbomonas tetramitiformis]|uniref:RING-type domain-containing protein n=1 Tax=Cymbomonas tetramitiformis TaxID=36881 RepID=A0AAE0BPG4_9CHLO|nr:hypothetical protein CYMTET_50745 [Cymbomonas tetramitiformis]